MVPLPREIEVGPHPAGTPPLPLSDSATAVAIDNFRVHAMAALRAEGYRMTQQRGALLALIAQNRGHLDAVGLHQLARAADPRISISTVYRTLSLLKRHALVTEVHLNEEHHHYEARIGEAHYHLICRVCGGVEEFGAEVLESMRQVFRRDFGFVVHDVDLDVSGTCKSCAA
jgi:Fur family ferric uptake transcriptional regulator